MTVRLQAVTTLDPRYSLADNKVHGYERDKQVTQRSHGSVESREPCQLVKPPGHSEILIAFDWLKINKFPEAKSPALVTDGYRCR